jgi:hypothetical protein
MSLEELSSAGAGNPANRKGRKIGDVQRRPSMI